MSVEIQYNLEGFEGFNNAMERLGSNMQRNMHSRLCTWATQVKNQAKQAAPIRTGALQNSIEATMSELTAQIHASAPHAVFIEFGTRFRKAQPFLLPAVQENLSTLEQTLCEAIDDARTEAGL